jgi:hypothetical protein
MGANLNSNVIVNVSTAPPAVGSAGFGVVLFAADSADLQAGFTERVRTYESAEDVTADSDLGDFTKAAVNAVFEQPLHVNTVKVGRVEADVAQVISFDFGGLIEIGDTISITVNGIATPYVAVSAVINDEVAALRALLITALAAEDVTVAGVDPSITVTADVAGEAFTYSSSYTAVATGTVVITETITTPNSNIGTELDAIVVADPAFYGLAIYSRVELQILRADDWVAVNNRLYIAQSADAAIFDGEDGTDVMSKLGARNRDRTALMAYKASASVHLDTAWPGYTLAADPDAVTTIWAHKPLQGIAGDTLTTTEKTAALTKNANVFLPMFGTDVTDQGKLTNGQYIDLRITVDWLTSRLQEAIATELIRVSALNQKIPYTDAGISVITGLVNGVILNGVDAGHFVAESQTVTQPLASEVSTADRTARVLRIPFEVEAAGAIQSVIITGIVAVDL